MSYQMGGTQRLCATCEYWIGPREPNYFGNMVVLADQSVKGKCFCLGGPHARADRFSNTTTCSRYEKWKVLQR